MLGFINATKYYRAADGLQIVLHNTTLLVQKGQRVGILAQSGSGKSTVIGLLGGVKQLDDGVSVREDSTSWPIGFTGMFHPNMSANANLKILAQLKGFDAVELCAFCQSFAELSDIEFYAPINTFSAGMRAKLGFALSMAIPFDFYLADEVLGAGNEAFRAKCDAALSLRLAQSGLILMSRSPRLTLKYCEQHGVLRDGKIIMCDSHEEACYLFEHD